MSQGESLTWFVLTVSSFVTLLSLGVYLAAHSYDTQRAHWHPLRDHHRHQHQHLHWHLRWHRR